MTVNQREWSGRQAPTLDDFAALAEACSRLLSDEALRTRLAQSARARAEEEFGWERIAAAHADALSQTVARRRGVQSPADPPASPPSRTR